MNIREPLVWMALVAGPVRACVAEKSEATPDTARFATGRPAQAPHDTAAVFAPVGEADLRMLMALINASEIGAGTVAARKGTSADVRSYASDMIADHAAMQQAVGGDTTTGPGMTAAGRARADTLRRVSRRQSDSLAALARGAAFDRVYIDQQLSAHSMALDSLLSWRRQTRSRDLRAVIDAAVPRVQSHLDRARAIQASLGGMIRRRIDTPADTSAALARPDTIRR